MRIAASCSLPERLRGVAYVDDDLPLGGRRYMMKPMVAAGLLRRRWSSEGTALVVRAGVGTGALLGCSRANVVALEKTRSRANRRSGLVDHPNRLGQLCRAPLLSWHRQRSHL